MNNQINNNTMGATIDESEQEFVDENKMHPEDYKQRVAQFELIIKASAAAIRLYNNPDFKLVIIDDYLINEPARLTGILASDKFQSPEDRKQTIEELVSIGMLKNRLSTIARSGEQAKLDLAELKTYAATYGLLAI